MTTRAFASFGGTAPALRGGASLAVVLCALSAGIAHAEPASDVPEPLKPWVPWVLVDAPDHACAFEGDRALCSWPGELTLDLDAHGGRFSQQVLLDRPLRFALPGSAAAWPLGVRVDGHDAAVLDADGSPGVQLSPGVHRIEGRFDWKTLPERLALPAQTALVGVRVGGQAVEFPKRDEQGELWLSQSNTGEEQGELIELTVARKIEDGVPVIVTTRIDMRVSGRAREVSLGRVLLEKTAPLSIQSQLPARLEQNGDLRLQVRAGEYRVELRARSDAPPERLAYRQAGAAWPESEVWVWQANEALRQVELSGAPAIDPARTELDTEWRGLPAFMLRNGVALQLATVRRGEPSPPPNRMTLARELWLDLDGGGYTVRDRIDTELRQGFRLDLFGGALGHVAAGNEDLLITKSSDGKHAGVELRAAQQSLVAEWRADAPLATLPAVGWSEDAQSLSTTLHLGPGFGVFAVRGADSVSQTWVEDWDLFDFFFVLLIAIAVGRLVGRRYALLALFALVVCHGEEQAPGALWFSLLACIALLRVLPAGLFRNLVRVAYGAIVLSMLVILLPFAAEQIRRAIYPQLEQAWAGMPDTNAMMRLAKYEVEPAAAPAAPPSLQAAAAPAESEEVMKEKSARGGAVSDQAAGVGVRQDAAPSKGDYGSYAQSKRLVAQQDPEATVQMGPGVPTWQWRQWQISWSGSVDKAHELRVYLISPLQNRALGFLRVLLLMALVALLLRCATPGRDRPGRGTASDEGGPSGSNPPPPAAVVASVLFALACAATLACSGTAHADLPDGALLDQLRARVTKPAECRPNCASIDELLLDVGNAGLTLTATVHAGERTSVRLPGPAATWVPATITLDHHADAPVILLEDGFLHVRVEAGVHVLEARGPLPQTDTLTLAFADRPHRTRVHAQGYKVDGVREDGRMEQAVQLSRLLAVEVGKPLESAALPPWLLLERTIELGPSWQTRNSLTRVTPLGTPIMVRVPLLPGESITDSAVQVVDGQVQVSFGRDDQVIEWGSRLATSARIELVAAKDKSWTEHWSLVCGPIWHCELSGLTPTHRVQDGTFAPEFVPWPGEQVSVAVSRPAPAAGASVAIDSADLDVTPGVRLQKSALSLHLRSSRGVSETLRLPAGARVDRLTIDGSERPMRRNGDAIGFSLEPGTHAVELQWQQPLAIDASMQVPSVTLARPSANTRLTVHLPQDRWLLWVSGPAWGPAVLFWGYLIFVLGVAFVLGRIGHSPLRTRDFVLLGLGLTQVPAPAALCVVGWFFAMAYRGRMPEQSRWPHNLTQLALAFWTWSALGCLYVAVHAGLLVLPDMQVAGAGSSGNELHWFADRGQGATLPSVAIWSAPLWVWRVLMLLWSLWLAARLVRWLPWAFGCFRHGGLWKKGAPRPRKPPPQRPPMAPPTAPAAPTAPTAPPTPTQT